MVTLLDDKLVVAENPSIAALSRPRSRSLDSAELAAVVADLAADPRNWRGLVRHDPDRRWWTRLISTDLVDAWLITWPGRLATDLHDHGPSAAALTVVEGTLEHVLASRGGGLSRERFSAGTLLTVQPWAVHDVGNPTSSRAVSIHAYSPPLSQMTFFKRDETGLRPVHTTDGNEPELEQPW